MKNKKVLFIFMTSLLCVACQNTNTLHLSMYNFEGEFLTQKIKTTKDNYYTLDKYDSLPYYKYDGSVGYINNFRDLYSSSNNPRVYLNAKSQGDLKALVIPVNFVDSDKSRNDEQLIYLQNAFFGDESVNNYESVSSYHHKSSYGTLKIEGMVTPFFNYSKTSEEMMSGSVTSQTRNCLGSALKWFFDNNPDFDSSSYDIDNDGYLDMVYLIYNHPYDGMGESDIFWAFADHAKKEENHRDEGPYGSTYVWMSYDFIESEDFLSETSILIHETGHIFGLEDYYNSSRDGIYQPTGYMDMMDSNLGDHSAFSKMLLNWITPKVVTGEGEIILNSFTMSGNALLLPTSLGYNNTPYDEYILVEYFTPTGLNSHFVDKEYSFISNGMEARFKYPETYGVKIYHIDARLGYFSMKGSNSYFATFDDPNLENLLENYRKNYSSYCIDFLNDNAVELNNKNENVLIHLLEKSGQNTFKEGKPFSEESMWYLGDTFGVDTFSDFKFNNGGELTYTLEVIEMTPTYVKLKINEK